MRFIASLALIVLVSFATAPLASAQELMPAQVAAKLGLVEAWNRTVSTPIGAQSISDIKLFAHGNDPHQYVEVVLSKPSTGEPAPVETKPAQANSSDSDAKGGDAADNVKVLTRIWVGQLDRLGNPLGMKEAQRQADNEVRRMKRRGIAATTRLITSPRIRLYSIADDGTLEARDAETGRTIWMTRVGDSRLVFGELGINDEHVVIVNGGNLIIVDVNNGEVFTEFRLRRTPIFGAINAGGFAMVMGIRGGVECYSLVDLDIDPFFETVRGYAVAPPTRAPGSTKVAWATNQGFVFVMELEGKPSTMFRLKTDGLVTGKIAAAVGDRFFFGSENGQVYAVRATRTGDVLWSAPFGEPFYGEPIVVDDQLFIRSTYGNLYCLATGTGVSMWDSTVGGVEKLVGAFGDQLFVSLIGGSLGVIDRNTGDPLGNFAFVKPARTIKNDLTNRLYLVDSRGVVQCLRPIDSELPTLNDMPEAKVVNAEEAKDEKSTDTKKNPFGADSPADPFGAGGSDPFGAGGADPFGAGGAAADDPFGSDPFGG